MDKELYNKHTILLVDDEKTNWMELNSIFSTEYTIFVTASQKRLFELVLQYKPALILIGLDVPGIDGFNILIALKSSEETQDIPVIIIAGSGTDEEEEKSFQLGAVDYIHKPFKAGIVKARVRAPIQIGDQIFAIEQMGMIDGLTNIPNRRCFDDRIAMEWRRARREESYLSFLMLDIDRFKNYNDTYGHPQGDTLLRAVAGIFGTLVRRAADLSTRLGGEEFGILLPNTKPEAALLVAERIRNGVKELRVPTADKKTVTQVTISIGVASVIPSGSMTLEEFIVMADRRLYTAKNTGRDRVCAE
ncbi:diguanylate cyclase response regulator [Spirochaetia bacterium]|nr:diguanylate cyclase response regulator [Spirochaetia bacterium]